MRTGMEEQVSTGTAAAAELFAPFPPSARDILILILIFFFPFQD